MKRNATESYVARSSLRLENTPVAINQKPQQNLGVIRRRARPTIAAAHRSQVKTRDHFHNKPRQMPLRKPLIHRDGGSKKPVPRSIWRKLLIAEPRPRIKTGLVILPNIPVMR